MSPARQKGGSGQLRLSAEKRACSPTALYRHEKHLARRRHRNNPAWREAEREYRATVRMGLKCLTLPPNDPQ